MSAILNETVASYSEWLAKLASSGLSPNGTYKVLNIVKPDPLPYGQVVFKDDRLNFKVIKLIDLENWLEVQKLLSVYGPIFRSVVVEVKDGTVRLFLSDSPGVVMPTPSGWVSY